ncbi:MAG: hypothetical protein OMM_12038, partial [Candidatus Magnetoglobus multicellularis str. Araruama]
MGVINFNKSIYGTQDEIIITVISNNKADFIDVPIFSTITNDKEIVHLLKKENHSNEFYGSININIDPIDADNILQVADNDIIIAEYGEEDSTSAKIDISKPEISGVQSINITKHSATINWETNE